MENVIKERPILFSAPMVRALLDGSKTQTRRVVKGMALDWLENAKFTPEYVADPDNSMCPYGKVGDRLWVRETFSVTGFSKGHETSTESGLDFEPCICRLKYPAYGSEKLIDDLVYENDIGADEIAQAHRASKKKSVPSIHMPRWASRINLEITGVRVERLNDISEADAIAEGAQRTADCFAWHIENDQHRSTDPRDTFASLWESINGAGSWQENPWVWVVEFKRI